MKLLRVIHSTNLESGGPIEGLVRTTEILLRGGHEAEVVSLESEHEVKARGFHFPVIGIGRGVGKYGFNPELSKWIRSNAGRFDAVILHGLWNYTSVGAWLGLRHSSTPYHIFTHGMLDPWFGQQYPIKHLSKAAYWWAFEGRVLRDAKSVLFTSEEERVRAQGAFRGHAFTERVVRYGATGPAASGEANRGEFVEAFPGLKSRKYLLFLGRIHQKKGCDLLIRAFASATRSGESDLDLAIAGPDQVGWAAELKTMAEKLGIGERVHWLGMLSGGKKWGALEGAEAMILPSHQENFGIVVAEAMACSTPVLISDKVNIWREVLDSKGGLVAPDTEEGIRSLIERFLGLSATLREDMRRAARQGFEKYFDAEAAAADFAEAIGFGSAPNLQSTESLNIA